MEGSEARGAVFRFARDKVLLLAIGAFVFAALCGFLIHTEAATHGSFKEAALYAGIPFFALCGVIGLRYAGDKGEVVVISPAGIKDTRIASDTIPWHAVRSISVKAIRGQRFIMLDVDPAFEQTMTLTRMAAWTKPMNEAIGFKGLAVNPGGLDGSLDQLIAAMEKFAQPAAPPANA